MSIAMGKITADLVPHTLFHKGIWLQSVENPGWYYFMKKENRNKIKNISFIKSVDEPLKELVQFLHKRNIKTTPSCSGHHIIERDLEKIYNSLESDGEKIRDTGIKLKDVETDKEHLFYDKHYLLPWSKKVFLEKLELYQQKGVLGIKLGNRKKAKEEVLNLKIDGVSTREKDAIIFIFTNENKKGDNKSTWKEITKQVKKILK
jgi:hypothetical protein